MVRQRDISMAITLSRWQPRDDGWRYPQLFVGSATMTAIGLYLAQTWDLPQWGLMSLFLGAAALVSWFRFLLDENSDAIWGHKRPPVQVHRRTALSVLAMFMGVAAALSCAAALLGGAETRQAFDFVFSSAGVAAGTGPAGRFGDLAGLLRHNCLVLVAFFSLAFVYHAYGALLAIFWNACAWAMVLTVFVSQAATVSELWGPLYVVCATGALLPHLILEAAAYVLATLASIFLSRALFGSGGTQQGVRPALLAAGRLLALALLVLAAAAAVETILPPAILGALR